MSEPRMAWIAEDPASKAVVELARKVAETITIEARLVALTNSDLARLVADGQFREDLFFRLSVLTISVPALRERPWDILPLADALLERAARVHARPGTVFAEPLRRMLVAYSWPGNVRELKNAIERALVFSTASTLAPEDFPESVRAAGWFLPSATQHHPSQEIRPRARCPRVGRRGPTTYSRLSAS